MGRPGGLLPPAHAGGGCDAQQVDGVGLQVFEEVLSFPSGQLHLRDCALGAGAIGQAVGRDSSSTQLVRQGLPRHLDVHGAVAGQAELRGAQGNCRPTG